MKKHLSWIIELLVWALAILLVIMSVSIYNNVKLKQKHRYQVFFSDANGLKNGSPVKLMGKEIGYVSSVQVINGEEIFVSFIITDPNINIPTKSTARISSTGLVGSRSLELRPPQEPVNNNDELIVPINPYRVQHAYSTSTSTSEMLYNASSAFNQKFSYEKLPVLQNTIQDTADKIVTIPNVIYKTNQKEDILTQSIQNNNKINSFINKLEKWIK